MKSNKFRISLLLCLFFIEILSLFLVYKSYTYKEINETKEKYVVNMRQFAMFVESEEGKYSEYTSSNIFPEGYKINMTKSNCVDTKGNVIEGILSGTNNSVTVTSNKTTYCYIFFDIDYVLSELCSKGDNLGSCLTANNEEIDSLGDIAYADMYRYTGTNEIVDDNYICFGTTDKNTCINNLDKYMYRIIGVTSEDNSTLGLDVKQLKLIKYSSIGNMQWYTDNTTDKKWEDSIIYQNINGSNFLINSTYMPSGWSSKISSAKWNIGDTVIYANGSIIYDLESSTQTTNQSKIGLMYLSDYYYAYNFGGNIDCSGNKCLSWLKDESNHTWTMTRYGYNTTSKNYIVWELYMLGSVGQVDLTDSNSIRPVFYLNEEETYVSGDGTINNPIMLADKEPPEGNSISINNNATYTTSTSVTLSLSSEGATELCMSESTSCSNWEEYKTSKSFTLSNTLGTKTIYVTYRDAAGNVSEQVSDTIALYEEISTVPSQNGSLTYTGSNQSAKWNNYDSSKLTIGGTTSSTNAGTFNATFTPKTNHIWSDGTQTSKTVSWSIGKASGSLSVSPTSLTINIGKTGTIAVTRAGDGKITATSSNTSVATLSMSGTTITITGKSVGTSTITIKVAAGTNHTAPSNKTVSVTIINPFGEYLISKKTTGWNSTAYSGMYRYIGTSANNYVKLGNILYRVIGVTSTANSTLGLAKNQVKIIKAENIGTYNWHSSSINVTWDKSTRYSYLQSSSVLGNTSVIPSGWSGKISSVKWNTGDVQTWTNGNTVYGLEDDAITSTTSKIGLMYLSDYYYAYNAGGTVLCGAYNCTSWLTDTSNTTLTMTRYGYSTRHGCDYNAWSVAANGYIDYYCLAWSYAVRPVFYLATDVSYKSGSGTSEDPFIIE